MPPQEPAPQQGTIVKIELPTKKDLPFFLVLILLLLAYKAWTHELLSMIMSLAATIVLLASIGGMIYWRAAYIRTVQELQILVSEYQKLKKRAEDFIASGPSKSESVTAEADAVDLLERANEEMRNVRAYMIEQNKAHHISSTGQTIAYLRALKSNNREFIDMLVDLKKDLKAQARGKVLATSKRISQLREENIQTAKMIGVMRTVVEGVEKAESVEDVAEVVRERMKEYEKVAGATGAGGEGGRSTGMGEPLRELETLGVDLQKGFKSLDAYFQKSKSGEKATDSSD